MKKLIHTTIRSFIFIIISSTILLISNTGFSQVTANFTLQTNAGCSPLLVQFVNTSTGDGNLTYNWDFGNGNSSNLKDPQASYIADGIYTVKLTTTSGQQISVKEDVITVYKNPEPDFALSDSVGCVPHNVSFFSSVSNGNFAISAWQWNFGNGNTSNSAQPNVTYTTANNFDVSLRIVDLHGCSGTIIKQNCIKTNSLPNLNFTANNKTFCDTFGIVEFTYTSVIANNIAVQWNFGDGTNSTEYSPTHRFSGISEYNVSLTAINENGCTASQTKLGYIKILGNIALFSIEKDTVCIDEEISLLIDSDSTKTYNWDFGNNITSNINNPQHSYTEDGLYIISLNATLENSCSAFYQDTINVERINANFESDINYSCELPVDIQFTDLSENAVSWEWKMGNGNVYNNQNPINSYNTSHYTHLNVTNLYSDTLIVTSENGCKDIKVIENNMAINLPKAYFLPHEPQAGYNSQISGCVPIFVPFTSNSVYNTSQDQINSYFWDFGDGNTSNFENPEYTFNVAGEFLVQLTITTSLGCTDQFSTTVRAGEPQQANFQMYSPDTICASSSIYLEDLSTNSTLINGWQWAFSDGSYSLSRNPTILLTDTGNIDVNLIVSYNNCPSDPKIVENQVYVNPPIGLFTSHLDCNLPFEYSLSGNYTGVDRFYWDFGDNSAIDSITRNPIHTFSETGDYIISLSSFNDSTGCSYNQSKIVIVRDIQSAFSIDTIIGCPGMEINLDPTLSNDEVGRFRQGNTLCKYKWTIDDTRTVITNGNFSEIVNSPGVHTYKLTVMDHNYCPDEITHSIKIYKPVAEFISTDILGCTPFETEFLEQVISDTTYSLIWDLGNNSTSANTNPIQTTYNENGYYTVKLFVQDILGCTDSIVKQNYIYSSRPEPNIIADIQAICVGNSVGFSNLNNDSIQSYFWDFGDGNTSDSISPINTYSNSGYFNVSLNLVDVFGCDSSVTISNLIYSQSYPDADFSVDTNSATCYPYEVQFNYPESNSNILSMNWNFGDGNTLTEIINPNHNYTIPGNYSVSLIVETTNGCKDTANFNDFIHIGGPFAQINIVDSICKGEPVLFNFENLINTSTYTWDFGDGSVGVGDSIFHEYNRVGKIFPRLMLFADSIHTCDKYIEDSVYIHMMLSDFVLNNNNYCTPLSLDLTNNSFGASEFIWMLSDSIISESNINNIILSEPGEYSISLTATNSLSCEETLLKTINVFPLPQAIIMNDSLICYGNEIMLNASGGTNYQWGPIQEFNNPNISNPIVSPSKTTTFNVIVIDENSCTDTDSLIITVQQIPQINMLSNDTSIIIGETAYTNVYSGETLNYSWFPTDGLSCANCPKTEINTLENQTYTITASDTNMCFEVYGSITINIREEYTIDVPTAFTPNNDGINDVLFVDGWGLMELIDFKIFNQWGELVFVSHDLNFGWDAYYKGKLQPIDSYTYLVEAKNYEGQILSKKGTVAILK